MSHVREKRWSDIRNELSGLANDTIRLMSGIRKLSIQLFLLGSAYGGNESAQNTAIAAQLFRDEINARQQASDAKYYEQNPGGTEPPVVGPSALEISMVADARLVSVALNELWGAANNVVTETRDRMPDIHRIA